MLICVNQRGCLYMNISARGRLLAPPGRRNVVLRLKSIIML